MNEASSFDGNIDVSHVVEPHVTRTFTAPKPRRGPWRVSSTSSATSSETLTYHHSPCVECQTAKGAVNEYEVMGAIIARGADTGTRADAGAGVGPVETAGRGRHTCFPTARKAKVSDTFATRFARLREGSL